MRIEDMITQDESNWYFNKFSPLLPLKMIGVTNETLNFDIRVWRVKVHQNQANVLQERRLTTTWTSISGRFRFKPCRRVVSLDKKPCSIFLSPSKWINKYRQRYPVISPLTKSLPIIFKNSQVHTNERNFHGHKFSINLYSAIFQRNDR